MILLSQTATFTIPSANAVEEGLPGSIKSNKDVIFKTSSYPDSGLQELKSAGESISFPIYTYVDGEAVGNIRLVILSLVLLKCDMERPEVFFNNHPLGKLSSTSPYTTFKINPTSVNIDWRLESVPWGENIVKIKIPSDATYKEKIAWGEIRAEQRPIVFLPGVGGTELKNKADDNGLNDLEWPDPDQYILSLPGNKDYLDDLELNKAGTGPTNPSWKIYPGDPIRTSALTLGMDGTIQELNVYGHYLDFLGTKGYYSNQTINDHQKEIEEEWIKEKHNSIKYNPLDITDNPNHNVRLWEIGYDWRLDNSVHAKQLAIQIDKIIETKSDGWKKIILTAHSMGGLVAKKYIAESGGDKIKFLFSMGTPYYGAVKPVKFLKIGDKFDIPVMDDNTLKPLVQNWPAVYQLLATQTYWDTINTKKLDPPYYFRGLNGGPADEDSWTMKDAYIADPESKFSNKLLMNSAIKFHKSLGTGFKNVEKIYIAVGTGHETITNMEIDDRAKPATYTLITNKTGGDGTVPYDSARAEKEGTKNIERKDFVEGHVALSGNTQVQKWLWSKVIDDVKIEKLSLHLSPIPISLDSFDVPENNNLPAIHFLSSHSSSIPDWVKQNAKWWSDGMMSDSEFAKGIEFLIENKVIRSDNIEITNSNVLDILSPTSYLELSNSELILSKQQSVPITISGDVKATKRATPVEITIEKPDGAKYTRPLA